MKKRSLCLLFGALLAVIILGACSPEDPDLTCSDPLGCASFRAGDPVKIGVLLPVSGELKAPGEDQLKAFKLALEDRHWTIGGPPIELIIEDSHCSKEGGITGALKLAADPQIVAIFGTYCSIAATRAASIISEKGLIMISAGNTAPSLTSVRGVEGEYHTEGYFPTSHNDRAMGRAVADFAKNKLALNKAATINDGVHAPGD